MKGSLQICVICYPKNRVSHEFKFHTKDGYDLAHPCLKPPGSQSFIRFRSLGPEYDFDAIRRKVILSATLPGVHKIPEVKPYREWNPPPETTMGILPKIYRRYCIRLYGYVRQPRKREYIPMAIREDVIKLDHYIEQMDCGMLFCCFVVVWCGPLPKRLSVLILDSVFGSYTPFSAKKTD